MPYGSHPIYKQLQWSDGGPNLATRILDRFPRTPLDLELAQGADPADRPDLALRAHQLRSTEERARIANALVEALGETRRAEPVTSGRDASARRCDRPRMTSPSSRAGFGTAGPRTLPGSPWRRGSSTTS
jgi:hypothetical protein